MSHLDDGQIAELIDGQLGDPAARHADTCIECRDRVAAARRVQERARAILRSADSAEAPPPFAEVLTRAGYARRVWRRPYRALAWAATVALAAGIGWYGRALVWDEPSSAPLEVAQAAPSAPAVAAPAEGDADLPAPTRARPADPTPAPLGGIGAAAAGAGAPPPAGARDLVAMDRFQPPAPAPTSTGRADLREAAPERVEARSVVTAEEAQTLPWRSVTLDEAQALLGGDLQRVEGLRTLGYAVRAVRGGVEVRTEQRLESGSVLELLQRRADEPPVSVALPPPEAARQRVDPAAPSFAARQAATPAEAVRRGPFLITGRAPISLDSLRALLLRLH